MLTEHWYAIASGLRTTKPAAGWQRIPWIGLVLILSLAGVPEDAAALAIERSGCTVRCHQIRVEQDGTVLHLDLEESCEQLIGLPCKRSRSVKIICESQVGEQVAAEDRSCGARTEPRPRPPEPEPLDKQS